MFLMLQGDCVSKREACLRTLMNSVSAVVAVQPRSAHVGPELAGWGGGCLAPAQSRAADTQSHCGTFVWIYMTGNATLPGVEQL